MLTIQTEKVIGGVAHSIQCATARQASEVFETVLCADFFAETDESDARRLTVFFVQRGELDAPPKGCYDKNLSVL